MVFRPSARFAFGGTPAPPYGVIVCPPGNQLCKRICTFTPLPAVLPEDLLWGEEGGRSTFYPSVATANVLTVEVEHLRGLQASGARSWQNNSILKWRNISLIPEKEMVTLQLKHCTESFCCLLCNQFPLLRSCVVFKRFIPTVAVAVSTRTV